MLATLLYFSVTLLACTVLPIWVYFARRRDICLLLFGLLHIFTMNTSLMAVIRDFGGMPFLSRIGREPWFAMQYPISMWAAIGAHVALGIFFFRMLRRSASTPTE